MAGGYGVSRTLGTSELGCDDEGKVGFESVFPCLRGSATRQWCVVGRRVNVKWVVAIVVGTTPL